MIRLLHDTGDEVAGHTGTVDEFLDGVGHSGDDVTRVTGRCATGTSPHDVAGGALLVREAGGLVSDFRAGEDWLRGGKIVAGGAAPLALVALYAGLGAYRQRCADSQEKNDCRVLCATPAPCENCVPTQSPRIRQRRWITIVLRECQEP